MNKRDVIILVAFLFGTFSAFGLSELASLPTALARDQNTPPAPAPTHTPGTNQGSGKTVIVPVQPSGAYVADVPKAILVLQGQVLQLQEQVSTLQQELQAQKTALEKLRLPIRLWNKHTRWVSKPS